MQQRKSETEAEFKARRSAYNAATRDPVRNRENAKAWAEANRDRKRANNAAWRADNAELLRQIRANWKTRNKERIRIYKQTRRARAASSVGVLSIDIAARLGKSQRGQCANCRKKFGEYHIDHIVPLALGGANEDSNVQLLCPPCNWRKNAMHPIDFAQQEGRLL